MTTTRSLPLFETSHVAVKGTDNFHTWPAALAHLKLYLQTKRANQNPAKAAFLVNSLFIL